MIFFSKRLKCLWSNFFPIPQPTFSLNLTQTWSPKNMSNRTPSEGSTSWKGHQLKHSRKSLPKVGCLTEIHSTSFFSPTNPEAAPPDPTHFKTLTEPPIGSTGAWGYRLVQSWCPPTHPSPPPGISIIQEDKVSRTWEWKAACSPPSWVNILTVSSNKGGIRGDPSMESVLSCSDVSATSASTSMKCKELKAVSRCVGTVCADGLTNLTTDWLWKWLSSTLPVLLLFSIYYFIFLQLLLPLAVSHSFPDFLYCLLLFSCARSFCSFLRSPPTAVDKKAEGK